ncbi:hypothetical protein O1611_g4230 [Lasiodiplodia mahajangana]|uniref:Uncharacterized protein n=1 Tax=Lasiodiplodia mahajangana TaxID=1108764 RepID=A0ACC2JQ67_9PEZI|nr:hypothetical protein O1611_g4230 [Lasiodiplodia mahajangana]
MSTATEELRLKLGIGEGTQIDAIGGKSILEALKRNASFTLKRREYEEILSKIKAGNATLQNLSGQNQGLEPDRRRRSQSRVTSLLRGLSQSIYNALCSAITCACSYPHSIGLQLSYRDVVMLPNDVEEIVAQKFDFPITLKLADKNRTVRMRNGSGMQIAAHWMKFQLRLLDDGVTPTSPAITSPLPASPSHKRRVAWASSVINRERSNSSGLVNPMTHITLRQIVDETFMDLPPFGFEERLRVALILSISLLHLSGTPWLARAVLLDDIVFMVEDDDSTNQPPRLIYQPFVIKSVSDKPQPSPTNTPMQALGPMRPVSLEVLSLGAILIQIIIGRVDNALSMADTMDSTSIMSMRERGRRLDEEIRIRGGTKYAEAVEWCLDSIYRIDGLQNERFCQDFYENVIGPLEDDLKTIALDG